LKSDHPDLAAAIFDLGQNRVDLRQFQQAEPLLREALQLRQDASVATAPSTASARSIDRALAGVGSGAGTGATVDRLGLQIAGALGETLVELGKFEEAQALLSGVWTALQPVGANPGSIDPKAAQTNADRQRQALQRIIRLYVAWGKPAKAEQYQAILSQLAP
jgi:tetratricopeptide (TPR) repeat protein